MNDLTWRIERRRGPCKRCGGTGFCQEVRNHPESYDGCADDAAPSCARCGEEMSWGGDRWVCSNEGMVEAVRCSDCLGVSGGTVLIGTQVSAHHADGSTAWVSGLLQTGPELRAACARSGLLTGVEAALELGARIRATVGS